MLRSKINFLKKAESDHSCKRREAKSTTDQRGSTDRYGGKVPVSRDGTTNDEGERMTILTSSI